MHPGRLHEGCNILRTYLSSLGAFRPFTQLTCIFLLISRVGKALPRTWLLEEASGMLSAYHRFESLSTQCDPSDQPSLSMTCPAVRHLRLKARVLKVSVMINATIVQNTRLP